MKIAITAHAVERYLQRVVEGSSLTPEQARALLEHSAKDATLMREKTPAGDVQVWAHRIGAVLVLRRSRDSDGWDAVTTLLAKPWGGSHWVDVDEDLPPDGFKPSIQPDTAPSAVQVVQTSAPKTPKVQVLKATGQPTQPKGTAPEFMHVSNVDAMMLAERRKTVKQMAAEALGNIAYQRVRAALRVAILGLHTDVPAVILAIQQDFPEFADPGFWTPKDRGDK